MTFVEVYPGQQFLPVWHNGAVVNGHLQKVPIGVKNMPKEKFMK